MPWDPHEEDCLEFAPEIDDRHDLGFSFLLCSRIEGAEPIDTLASLWESQQTEIVTAHIKCRLSRFGGDDIARLSRQQLHEILGRQDLKRGSAAFKGIMAKLWKTPSPADTPGGSMEYFYEGARFKELHHPSGYCHVYNGELEGTFDGPNRQAMVYNFGAPRLGVRSLRDFRMVPNPKVKKDLVFVNQTGDRVELRSGRNSLIVDATTGVVYQYTRLNEKEQVLQETIQDYYTTYPGAIIFPSLAMDVMYNAEGLLAHVDASWVDSAEFNRDLPKDAFTLPVPANTQVFDKRVANQVRSIKVAEPAPDALELIKTGVNVGQADTFRATASVWRGFGWWWVLGAAVVAVLLSFIGWLYFRKHSLQRV